MNNEIKIPPCWLKDCPSDNLAGLLPYPNFTIMILPNGCNPVWHIYHMNMGMFGIDIQKVIQLGVIVICHCSHGAKPYNFPQARVNT